MCLDMCTDMCCIDICAGMCITMCVAMCLNMCIDMRIGMHIDMDLGMGMCLNPLTCVWWWACALSCVSPSSQYGDNGDGTISKADFLQFVQQPHSWLLASKYEAISNRHASGIARHLTSTSHYVPCNLHDVPCYSIPMH